MLNGYIYHQNVRNILKPQALQLLLVVIEVIFLPKKKQQKQKHVYYRQTFDQARDLKDLNLVAC